MNAETEFRDEPAGIEGILSCFGIDRTIRSVAIVGGGGKTSLMYALAAAIHAQGDRVITTTTTRILVPASHQSPDLLLLEDDPNLNTLGDRLKRFGHVTVGGALLPEGKLKDVPPACLRSCLTAAQWVLMEADGAKGLPVKAPEAWEPAIPDFTDMVIPVLGLDCLGKPADERTVFRLNRFLSVAGIRENETITGHALARLLSHPFGLLKGVPDRAAVVPFLNKADLLTLSNDALAVAGNLLSETCERIERIVVGSLKERVQLRAITCRHISS